MLQESLDARKWYDAITLSFPFRDSASRFLFTLIFGLGLTTASCADAAENLNDLRRELRDAGQLYKEGKFRECAERIQTIQIEFDALPAAAKKNRNHYQAVHDSLRKARALLELEGFSITVEKPRRDDISYAEDVYPILRRRCGQCHIDDRQGGLSMRSHRDLMSGGDSGASVRKRNPDRSLLIQRVTSGEMPPEGPELPDAERQLLISWVESGARLDREPEIQATATTEPTPAVTTDGEVSFSNHLAPVFAEQCTGCHGRNNPRNDLSMVSYARMQRGGDGGPLWQAGQPATSLLVQKLKGIGDGQRMPLNRPPLSDDQIRMVERWISAGAEFDGDVPNQPLQDLATAARLKSASAEEISEERRQLAGRSWALVYSNQEPDYHASDHWLVVGNQGESVLASEANFAESVFTAVDKVLRFPSDAPARKGRLSLFLLPNGYDYNEFGQMVERRAVPPGQTGHWRTPGLDAYLVVLGPKDKDDRERFRSDLCRGIVGAQLELTGAFPRWFVEGAAEAVQARVNGKATRKRDSAQKLSEAWDQVDSVKQITSGDLPPDVHQRLAGDFVQQLLKNRRAFQTVLRDMEKGKDFDQAIAERYGQTTDALMNRWWQNGQRSR